MSAVRTRKYVLLLQLPLVLLVPLQCFFYCSPSQPILSLQKHLFSLPFSPNLFLLKTYGPNFQFLFYSTSGSLTRFLSTSSTSFYSRPIRPENPRFSFSVFPPEPYVAMPVSSTSPKNLDFRSNDCRLAGMGSSLVTPLPLLPSPSN